MKKLMFAAALATVCGAVQADPIASDIVGYQNKDLGEDYQILVATFENVGREGMAIQDIKPAKKDNGTDLGDGSFDMQTIKSTGRTDELFQYKTVDEDNVPSDGWYDMNNNKATKDFEAGQGLFFYSYWDDASLRFKAL